MNIQNLNSQELEQLQTLLNKQLQILLNKMNEPTPLQNDPVEEMIEGIMDNFDFGRVQHAMGLLDWGWRGEYVTVKMLREEAERLLRGAINSRFGEFIDESDEIGITNSTGGLEAKAWCDEDKTHIVRLELKFVLGSWDESIDEY
jgi:hypothetical protein